MPLGIKHFPIIETKRYFEVNGSFLSIEHSTSSLLNLETVIEVKLHALNITEGVS